MKIKVTVKIGRRWSHKDGIPVFYSRLHPDGLSFGLIPAPPDCPIRLAYEIRIMRETLKAQRATSRVLFHKIKVWRRKLSEVPPFESKSEAA